MITPHPPSPSPRSVTPGHLWWDLLAMALVVTGGAMVALTREPGWTALLLLGSAASGLGRAGRWWPVLVGALSSLGVAGVALGLVLGGQRAFSSEVLMWALQSVALVVATVLALILSRRLRAERSETARALAFAADISVHDSLTGLANRRGLALLGGQILESARRRGDAVYCIFIDVDGLGQVNDELGHSAGDDVLLTVAEGLRRTTRATDAVARWGGGDFVVVGAGTGLAPLEMERRIRAHCIEHTSIARSVWQARVSAGGSVLEPWDDGTIDTMLGLADREMHLRRALRREASAPAYRPTRLEQSPLRPSPRNPGSTQQ